MTSHEAREHPPKGSWLPRGAGRSYGDVCLNDGGMLITTADLDQVVSLEASTGRLAVQAGCTFAQLYRVLMPAGWQLPVVPGTRLLTVGGAIANDIHGKNHHVFGTIGRYVQALTLWRSDGSITRCTPTEQPDLFRATIGGLGLTGLILEVELQLVRIASTALTTQTTKTHSLMDTMDVLRHADREWVHTVAWIDLLCDPPHAGRGQVLVGREAARTHGIKPPSTTPGLSWLPILGRPLLRPSLVRIGNAVKWGRQRLREERGVMDFASFFHPLDAIDQWSRAYGPSGFLQYQFVVPDEAGYETMVKIMRTLRDHGVPVYLAVLKRFGDLPSPGWLSFPRKGWTLAMDLPFGDGTAARVLRDRCDPIVLDAGGRVYPAKDACLSAATYQAMFPEWERVEQLRDPQVTSSFWRRVTGTS